MEGCVGTLPAEITGRGRDTRPFVRIRVESEKKTSVGGEGVYNSVKASIAVVFGKMRGKVFEVGMNVVNVRDRGGGDASPDKGTQ